MTPVFLFLKNITGSGRSKSLGIIIIFLLLLGGLAIITYAAPVHRFADGSTYYMQITSIAKDFDIQYQPVDIQRALTNTFDDLPNGLFLIKTDEGNYFYGKEFSYALFAAPFFLLLGDHGILFFNGLMLWGMIFMGYLYLERKGNSRALSCIVSALFFLLSTAFVYLFWIHVEIYNMFLITAGIFCCTRFFDTQQDKYLVLAALVFGVATVAKISNCLLFIPFIAYELYTRQFKRVAAIICIFLLPVLFFYGYFYLETGSMTFYGGNRMYYLDQFPYTGGFDGANEIGHPAFSVEEGRISGLLNTDIWAKSPLNLFYYFFGKFTGMVWYYPLTVFALLTFVIGILAAKKRDDNKQTLLSIIREDPVQYLILLGIILNILFFVIIIGNNYLGGQHAVGNRYFYIFPAFLFLITRINVKVIVPFILIALFTVVPVIANPIETSMVPELHTFRFPYTELPLEYSQINNLPLWIHKYTYPDATLYDIDGNSVSVNNTIFQKWVSTLVIKPLTKVDHMEIIVGSEEKSEADITIISGNVHADLMLTAGNPKKIEIPLKDPVYHDNEYRLYEISIRSPSSIFMLPQ